MFKRLCQAALSLTLIFSLSPITDFLSIITYAEEGEDYSDDGKTYSTGQNAKEDAESASPSSEPDTQTNKVDTKPSSENKEERPSYYDQEEEELTYEEDEFEKEEDEEDLAPKTPSYSTQSSSGSGFGLSNVVTGLVSQEAMEKFSNQEGVLFEGIEIDSIGDVRVDKELNISSYRWIVWHREYKTDEIDTSESDGNYHGFSKEKVIAWKAFESAIKKINNDSFPNEKEYAYPMNTPTQKFTFWADKPGYYDVYGDPLIDTVSLKAQVDVNYTAMLKEEHLIPADSISGAQGGGAPGAIAGGFVGGSGDVCDQITQLIADAENLTPEQKAELERAEKDCRNLQEKGNSGEEEDKKKSPPTGDKCTDGYVYRKGKKTETRCDAFSMVPTAARYSQEEGATTFRYTSGEYAGTYNIQTEGIKSHNLEPRYPTNTNVWEAMGKGYTTEDLITDTYERAKQVKSEEYDKKQDDHESDEGRVSVWDDAPQSVSTNITLAEAEIHNVYGSQLTRVGAVAVGMANDSWRMNEDEFWEEDPEYYEMEGDAVTVENKTDHPFGFCPKSDGDIIGGTTNFKNLVVHKKNLAHGYNEIKEEDLMFNDSDNKNSRKALEDNSASGKFVTPKIDPALDINNADSKYVGRVPLISFDVKELDETQEKKLGIKKYISLSQKDETELAADEKEKQRKEQRRKEKDAGAEEIDE